MNRLLRLGCGHASPRHHLGTTSRHRHNPVTVPDTARAGIRLARWPTRPGRGHPGSGLYNCWVTLEELRERRAFECRLDPGRALRSLDDAAAFVDDRGILTSTADSALPSLFGACHQPPYRAGKGGFAEWPETGYPWFWELAQRPGTYELSVHNGKKVLMTEPVAALADLLCRAELARAEVAETDGGRLLRHLATAGPSTLSDLKVELEWDAAQLRRARRPLERVGALVSRGITLPAGDGGHVHSSRVARWDQVFPIAAAGGGAAQLVVACVRAAVLAPEAEPARWFSWKPGPDAAVVDRLVSEGRLARPAPGWIAVP
jgi:hypothetical protein